MRKASTVVTLAKHTDQTRSWSFFSFRSFIRFFSHRPRRGFLSPSPTLVVDRWSRIINHAAWLSLRSLLASFDLIASSDCWSLGVVGNLWADGENRRDCGWLPLPALMIRVCWDVNWRYKYMEELIGRVHEGLWLAASACPPDSSMLRHSLTIHSYEELLGRVHWGIVAGFFCLPL